MAISSLFCGILIWNPIADGVARYYGHIIILLICAILLNLNKICVSRRVTKTVIILHIISVLPALIDQSNYSHKKNTPIANFILNHFPTFYNPQQQIFLRRELASKNAFESNFKVAFHAYGYYPTKILFEDLAEFLVDREDMFLLPESVKRTKLKEYLLNNMTKYQHNYLNLSKSSNIMHKYFSFSQNSSYSTFCAVEQIKISELQSSKYKVRISIYNKSSHTIFIENPIFKIQLSNQKNEIKYNDIKHMRSIHKLLFIMPEGRQDFFIDLKKKDLLNLPKKLTKITSNYNLSFTLGDEFHNHTNNSCIIAIVND